MDAMRVRWFPLIAALVLGAGCAGGPSVKPVETLDERSGVTVGSLADPIELVQSDPTEVFVAGKRPSFALLGPVEWDQMGVISEGLWIHIAPVDARPIGDIRAPAAITLLLDEQPLMLSAIEAPQLGREPYKRAAPWGHAAYFTLGTQLLKRMAASRDIKLQIRAQDDSIIVYSAAADAPRAIAEYMKDRGITAE